MNQISSKNQELFSSHPNIVRSSFNSFNESDIASVKFPQLLVEAEHDWSLKSLKNSLILPDILCKYHNNLVRINGKHPFSWALNDIIDLWPKIIDYLSSNKQTRDHLSFLKEFVLDIFSSYKYQLLQYDLIHFFERSFLLDIVHDILKILPRMPQNSFFSISQKLIVLTESKELLLDQILTRLEMGYPVMVLSKLFTIMDLENISWQLECALMVTAAYILGKTLDKSLCLVWVKIIDDAMRRFDKIRLKQDYLIILKRIMLWPLIKIETDKTCEKGYLLV
jgi:hypothetical protein